MPAHIAGKVKLIPTPAPAAQKIGHVVYKRIAYYIVKDKCNKYSQRQIEPDYPRPMMAEILIPAHAYEGLKIGCHTTHHQASSRKPAPQPGLQQRHNYGRMGESKRHDCAEKNCAPKIVFPTHMLPDITQQVNTQAITRNR